MCKESLLQKHTNKDLLKLNGDQHWLRTPGLKVGNNSTF